MDLNHCCSCETAEEKELYCAAVSTENPDYNTAVETHVIPPDDLTHNAAQTHVKASTVTKCYLKFNKNTLGCLLLPCVPACDWKIQPCHIFFCVLLCRVVANQSLSVLKQNGMLCF